MAYAKISNLYKRPDYIDVFKKVWVLEKIHGTSAHVSFSDKGLHFFAGGADYTLFVKLFNQEELLYTYKECFHPMMGSLTRKNITFYGEAYGGKLQGMSHTYGKELKFIVFDIKVSDKWLDVEDAAGLAERFSQEFVWHKLIDNTIDNLNKYKDQPSQQAIRNLGDSNKKAEGIVSKPLYECYDKNGGRWIVKHKRDDFAEVRTPREIDPSKVVILNEASAVATEWVTEMRLMHILDKLEPRPQGMEDTKRIIQAMTEDIIAESTNEVDWSAEREIRTAIGKETAKLFRQYWQDKIKCLT